MCLIKSIGFKASDDTTLEIDNYADTCVVVKQTLIIYDTHCFHTGVWLFTGNPNQYRTVSDDVSFECLRSGKTCLLMIYQAIGIPHPDHHLLCPMQCHMANIVANETPKFLCKNPDSVSHALVTP